MKNKYGDNLLCDFCKTEVCDQEHQTKCFILKQFVPALRTKDAKYDDIWGNVDEQLAITRIFVEIRNQRELLLDALNIKE